MLPLGLQACVAHWDYRHAPPIGTTGVCCHAQLFNTGVGDLNAILLVCVASTLPYLQILFLFSKGNLV